MDNRWCEHDEVAAECTECRLRLADARNELLTIRLSRARAQLEECAKAIVMYSPLATHYDGCEQEHPMCRLVRDIRKTLEGEDTCPDDPSSPPS